MSKFKKNRIVGIITAMALVTMFTVNIRHSLNGYGIKSMNLHPEVWAQTNGTGGSTSGGSTTGGNTSGGNTSGGETSGGNTSGDETSGTLWKRADTPCVYSFTGKANATITILDAITIKLNGEGNATYSIDKGCTNCTSGGNEQCTARYCPVVPGSN